MAALRAAQNNACIDAQIMSEKGQATGRLSAKITEAKPQIPSGDATDMLSCCNILKQIGSAQLEVLNNLVHMTSMLGRTISAEAIDNLLIPTRDSKSFIISGTVVPAAVVSGGTFIDVASVQVPEGYMGVLTAVGWQVSPNAAYPDVQWQLCSSGDPDPFFVPSSSFLSATLSTPMAFGKVFPQQRFIQLKVQNSSVGAIEVAGLLVGFFRPMTAISVG